MEIHILRLCYLYVKDYHLAEDLTQETFIKVYQNLGMFKGEDKEIIDFMSYE